MSKHTPGPWNLVETKHEKIVSSWDVVAGDHSISVFPYKRIYSHDRSQSGLVVCEERMANARLIAAAPELLEALKALLLALATEHIPDDIEQWSAMRAAQAAIQKATS